MHSELVCTEVDIAPFESAYLATAQTCHHLHIEEVIPIFLFLYFFKESVELFVAEDLLLGIICFWYRRAVCGILCNKAFLDSHIQCFVEHHVNTSHHAVGKLIRAISLRLDSALLFDLVIEFLNFSGRKR